MERKTLIKLLALGIVSTVTTAGAIMGVRFGKKIYNALQEDFKNLTNIHKKKILEHTARE